MQAKLFFYEITEAGYYPFGRPAPAFGGITESCRDLRDWVHRDSMRLSHTATYTPSDNSRITKAYCAGVETDEATGDFLITTWNESESFDGFVASITDQPAGEAEVLTTELPDDAIPGYPTYFWVFPAYRLYAAVQFSSGRNGRQEFDHYIRNFLDKFTKHVVYQNGDEPSFYEEETERTILGYSDIKGSNEVMPIKIFPRWKSHRLRRPGSLELIRSNRQQITKVLRKTVFQGDAPLEKTRKENIFDILMGRGSAHREHDPEEDLQIWLETHYSPTARELEFMIEEWQAQADEESRWNDIGFQLQGRGQPFWLSHSLPKATVELDLVTASTILIPGDTLLQALSAKRGTVLDIAGVLPTRAVQADQRRAG